MLGIPKIVSSRLQANRFVPSGLEPQHPDADLLGAFAEQTLSASERDKTLSHLATCESCREIVALAMPPEMASAPPPMVATESVAAADSENRRSSLRDVSPSGTKINRWFGFARPNLAWGALAAGVAVAASLVVLHPLQRQQQAFAPAPPAIAVTESKKSLESSNKTDQPAGGKSGISIAPRNNAHLEPLPLNNLDLLAANNLPQSSPTIAGTARPIQKAKPVPQVQAKADSNSPALGLSAATWRLEAGSLQRSLDNGQSWQSPITADHRLLCYASRESDVWAGGKDGTLLHSTDGGTTWSDVHPPQNLSGEIVRIGWPADSAASNAIRIVTSASETWNSEDGGATWTRN